jgi:hypothetical protein
MDILALDPGQPVEVLDMFVPQDLDERLGGHNPLEASLAIDGRDGRKPIVDSDSGDLFLVILRMDGRWVPVHEFVEGSGTWCRQQIGEAHQSTETPGGIRDADQVGAVVARARQSFPDGFHGFFALSDGETVDKVLCGGLQ